MAELFTEYYVNLLTNLLNIDTTTPMETGVAGHHEYALKRYAEAASHLGFKPVYFAPPMEEDILRSEIPGAVKEMYAKMGDAFLSSQPNLVMELGDSHEREATIMFNFHIDTVEGYEMASYRNESFFGRGAVDMKGPAVALLAGLQAALEEAPSLTGNMKLIIQAVSGEEGGAMGVYGTKLLCERGYVGALNVFIEPTERLFFDHSTTSMTAQITVDGNDSTDDAPAVGHNATLVLGFLAQFMTKALSKRLNNTDAKMCLSGLHTGRMHNKVYGSGVLKWNFAYSSMEQHNLIEKLVEDSYSEALKAFVLQFADVPDAAKTVREIDSICTLTWVKKELPVLNNKNETKRALLEKSGLKLLPKYMQSKVFTCDAMWAQGDEMYTVVYGPGSLETNNAHGENEYIEKAELEKFSMDIKKLILYVNEKTKKRVPK
ncbi:M20/M25/M40 family metallo-hydrolase [Bacillus mojavensis]|uniref:M20/M25/M40 family metallo-hydrolase n=1 Tax=Bacillus mojavensis TaxID=72360 RepID=UPI002DB8AAFD|nr:M20/M25/M40 family metallo-hydrolase [Bacillus mojavensis]MEC1291084.1 M20/M25/M40 family metallo-hydrolase [Bacillus mojavensis]MEC1634136.1 M20/M25/M40 family metallo-hydrolase [Bacillus mojavensis]MEC1704349.1 M20/M25/M40 family metallo-hydrolase [Bacillus mojavensis]MEC5245684.1 M20/M25/M40 family metallo-hydrolase [Bacillus mojavensis]